jgi:hypothetical protein
MGLLEPHGRGRRPIRRAALTEAGAHPAFIIHSLAHAVAALTAAAESGCSVILLSAPGAALYAGPRWWRALIEAARAGVPATRCTAMLDCGDDAGAAQGAIRAGVEAIVFTGRPDVAERLADIAGGRGAKIVTERRAASLDLADFFFADPDTLRRRCAEVLAQPSAASRDRM